jgi:hypothetical protein
MVLCDKTLCDLVCSYQHFGSTVEFLQSGALGTGQVSHYKIFQIIRQYLIDNVGRVAQSV